MCSTVFDLGMKKTDWRAVILSTDFKLRPSVYRMLAGIGLVSVIDHCTNTPHTYRPLFRGIHLKIFSLFSVVAYCPVDRNFDTCCSSVTFQFYPISIKFVDD